MQAWMEETHSTNFSNHQPWAVEHAHTLIVIKEAHTHTDDDDVEEDDGYDDDLKSILMRTPERAIQKFT